MVAARTKEPAGEVTGLLTWAQGLRSRGDEREEAIRCGSGFRIEPVARMCSFAAIAAKKGGRCAGKSLITDCCSSLRPGPVRGHRLDLGGRRLCRDLEEVGPNVEAVGGGSLNLAALTLFDMTSDNAFVFAQGAAELTGAPHRFLIIISISWIARRDIALRRSRRASASVDRRRSPGRRSRRATMPR